MLWAFEKETVTTERQRYTKSQEIGWEEPERVGRAETIAIVLVQSEQTATEAHSILGSHELTFLFVLLPNPDHQNLT